MPESGGPTTQSGAYFQNTVAAWFMARMLHEATRGPGEDRVLRVRCEAPEEVDDVVVTFEGGTHYVQVKEALSTGEGAWTKLWQHFWKQSERIDPTCDRLVLWGGQYTELFRGLDEMVTRAQSVPPGKRGKQVSEFVKRLTKKQLGWLDSITTIIHNYEKAAASGDEPLEITHADVFELLQVVDVEVKGNPEEIQEQAINTFLSGMPNAEALFSTLRDLAADKARTRGVWDDESLRVALVSQGMSLGTQSVVGETIDEIEVEPESLKQELTMHRRNLAKLRQQAAIFSAGEHPLHLLNKIEYEEKQIRDIEQQLGR